MSVAIGGSINIICLKYHFLKKAELFWNWWYTITKSTVLVLSLRSWLIVYDHRGNITIIRVKYTIFYLKANDSLKFTPKWSYTLQDRLHSNIYMCSCDSLYATVLNYYKFFRILWQHDSKFLSHGTTSGATFQGWKEKYPKKSVKLIRLINSSFKSYL